MSTKSSKKIAPPPKKKIPLWLPLIIIAGLALIVVALSGGGTNPSGADVKPRVSGGPALRVDQEKIDLGDVPLGEMVSVKFELTNVGDQPLQFTKQPYIEVAAGC